ncbi:MAG: hypothetical protein WCH31_08290 [Actinomycetes bacterium]
MVDPFRVRWMLFSVLVVVGALAGLAGGYGASTRESTLYRAETSLVVQAGSQPLPGGAGPVGIVATVRDLVTKNIVAQNVIKNLSLSESPTTFLDRLHVGQGDSSVLVISVDDGDPLVATRVTQEVATVFTQLVLVDFGQPTDTVASPIKVSIFDPAHALPGKVSPHLRRDLGWGGLLGFLVGLLVANLAAVRRRPLPWLPPPLPAWPVLEAGDRPAEIQASERPAPPVELPAAPEAAAEAQPDEPAQPAHHTRNSRSVPVLGDLGVDGGYGDLVDALLIRAAEHPFQTVLLVGDHDGAVSARVAHALAERGELAMWLRDSDADAEELDRLAARCAFVLVAGAATDGELLRTVDAVVAITNGVGDEGVAQLAATPGVNVVGTVLAGSDGAR